MKTKTTITVAVVLLVLLVLLGGVVWWVRAPHRGEPAAPPAAPATASIPHAAAPRSAAIAVAAPREPPPGQARATAGPSDAEGGVLDGRVVDGSRGGGIAGAELTFTSDAGAQTVRTRDDGSFELAPPAPGHFLLQAIAAPGFLPYAPELQHSTVEVALARGTAIRGVTVFLYPALDYRGSVVDARGAPVAGARIQLLGTPAGEQQLDKPQTEWTADAAGRFTFHAASGAVLEAVSGPARGSARLDRDVEITRQLTIAIRDAPGHRAVIAGRTIDETGAPIGDALIRATPAQRDGEPRATAFATSGPDGEFTLTGIGRGEHTLDADAPDRASAQLDHVAAGTVDAVITLDGGLPLAGVVLDADGKPAPSYTLLVYRRTGITRSLALGRSIIEPRGRFAVRIAKGTYELVAAASGWAPSPPTAAAAGRTDVTLSLRTGSTLRGTVVASDRQQPLPGVRVMRESNGGGASAQPANIGTVTRADGSFELTGLPPGALSIAFDAAGYNPRLEAGLTAVDGEPLGPITIALTPLAADEQPHLELVGIGTTLSPDGDNLHVERVYPGSGAEAAGIVAGDALTAVDGIPITAIGFDGAMSKIRGVPGTTVAITLQRGDRSLQLIVERRKLRA